MGREIHCEPLCIAASHPALPGHFPGQPVVPGVIVLERVIAAAERVLDLRVAGIPVAKFSRPLLPEQRAQLQLQASGTRVRFRVEHAGALIASGDIEVRR